MIIKLNQKAKEALYNALEILQKVGIYIDKSYDTPDFVISTSSIKQVGEITNQILLSYELYLKLNISESCVEKEIYETN